MMDLLNEMETALADLLQSGLATWGDGRRFGKLAAACEDSGLHTGANLMVQLQTRLDTRTHALEKDDLPLAALVFRATRYITLCREKCQADMILERWESEGGNL